MITSTSALPGRRVALPELLGDIDLCAIFDCTQQTLLNRLRRGELPAPSMVLGRRRYWPRDLIERFVRGELVVAKGGGIEGEGALQGTRKKKEARGPASSRAPVVGSTVPAKTGRAVVRNPKRKGGPDRGNSI